MAKELSVPERLKNLFELQLIDSQIDEIQTLKGELPMEVSDLEDDIVGLETRVERMAGQIASLETELSRHEANIKESEALILRYQSQMDNVKNNREYDALTKELELQKLEIQLSQKKIRQGNTEVSNKKETLAAAQERLDMRKTALEEKKVELKKIIEKTEKDEEKLKKKAIKARKTIEDRLLKSYDRIRTSYRNGLAVVHIERNACGGCFNKVPPQTQLEVNQRKNIIACEHCGRVLVDDNILNVGKEETEEA